MTKRIAWRRPASPPGIPNPNDPPGVNRFRAIDTANRDSVMCDPMLHLAGSDGEPNEGSDFCPICMGLARVTVTS